MAQSNTVLVTGASGFIARHIVLQLLQAGYPVRGAVRSAAKGEDVRRTMAAQLGETVAEDRLSFVELDLLEDAGWAEAMQGAGALLHTASPFPSSAPKDEETLIRPAVDGTLRALKAAQAAGVTRVVLTSSIVSVMFSDPMPDHGEKTEADWSDPDSKVCTAYPKSKTLAERAAWDFAAQHPEMALTTINPAFVQGPPLDDDFATSMNFIKRVMSGKDPAVPRLSFDVVDVRDVAKMHVAALEAPETAGQRLIANGGPLWFSQITDVLRAAYPERKIARRVAPDWFIRMLGLFDAEIRGILPTLGKRITCSNARARAVLQMDFIPPEEAVRAAARFMVENGHIR